MDPLFIVILLIATGFISSLVTLYLDRRPPPRKLVVPRPETLLSEVAAASDIPLDVLRTLLTSRETLETIVDLVRNPRANPSSVTDAFAQLYSIPRDVVEALTQESVRRPLIEIVRTLNRFDGRTRRFVATRDFTIGSTNTRVAEGTIVEWDGSRTATVDGTAHEAQLRGAIREGWIVPEEPQQTSPHEAFVNLARYAAMLQPPEDRGPGTGPEVYHPEFLNHQLELPNDRSDPDAMMLVEGPLMVRDHGSGISTTFQSHRPAPQAEPPRPDPPSAWDRLLEDE